MDLFTLNQKAFGLDFSDLSLKIIDLKKKGRFFDLASWGEIIIKPGIIEKGEIKDERSLISALENGLTKIKGRKIRTKNVVVSLPEQKAFLQVIKMPKMTNEELKSAVPFEAENHIPLPVEEAYLDFQIIPSTKGYLEKHLDVLVAAILKKTVDSYVSCLKRAGLKPCAFEIESQSISRALVKNELSDRSLLLIDFGKSRASFIIFSGYSIRFTSSIPISSDKLSEAIARFLKVDLAEAEKLKIRYGLTGLSKRSSSKRSRISGKRISQAMIPVLNNLVEQIDKYLNYYQTHAKNGRFLTDGKMVDKILLCGRGANLKGLPDFLSSKLKVPVELGNPWINILPPFFKKIPELSFEKSLGYTSALGLALRGARCE